MPRILLTLCTLVCALAGWRLGSHRHAPEQAAAPPANIATPQRVDQAIINAKPKTLDVPDILARMAAECGGRHQSEELSTRLFAELQDLKSEDFVGAVTAMLSSNDRRVNFEAQELVGYWAERDLPAARQWVLGMRGSPWISNFTGAVFDTWARSDFSGECDWLEAHSGDFPSKDHREAAGFSLAKAAARADPERGLRLLGILEPGGAGHAWNLYNKWVEREPVAAANRALREPDGKARRGAVNAVAGEWGPRDPAAARAWAEAIQDPILSRDTVVHVGSALGWKNPQAGANYLAQIPPNQRSARSAARHRFRMG